MESKRTQTREISCNIPRDSKRGGASLIEKVKAGHRVIKNLKGDQPSKSEDEPEESFSKKSHNVDRREKQVPTMEIRKAEARM